MKKIVLLLLPAFIWPTALTAESYWLLIDAHGYQAYALEKIEMESMAQCEEQAKVLLESNTMYVKNLRGYVCLKGK